MSIYKFLFFRIKPLNIHQIMMCKVGYKQRNRMQKTKCLLLCKLCQASSFANWFLFLVQCWINCMYPREQPVGLLSYWPVRRKWSLFDFGLDYLGCTCLYYQFGPPRVDVPLQSLLHYNQFASLGKYQMAIGVASHNLQLEGGSVI